MITLQIALLMSTAAAAKELTTC